MKSSHIFTPKSQHLDWVILSHDSKWPIKMLNFFARHKFTANFLYDISSCGLFLQTLFTNLRLHAIFDS